MFKAKSISAWIDQGRAGNLDGAHLIWELNYDGLVARARKKLGDMLRQTNAEEDVVQSAFESLRGREGKFPLLSDRDDFWQMLAVITACKAISQRAHHARAKGGHGDARNQAALDLSDADHNGIANVVGAEPASEFAALVIGELARVMDVLPDPTQRVIALRKLEGRTNPEIGRHLDCSLIAVERKL